MRRLSLTLLGLLACAVTAAAAEKDELKKLEGTWKVVAVEGGGKDVTRDSGLKALTIKGKTLTGLGPRMTLSTDATKKPKWLNITFDRNGKDATINAIYSLTGDELKIVIPLAPEKGSGKVFENKRPEGFNNKTRPEMTITAKREKMSK